MPHSRPARRVGGTLVLLAALVFGSSPIAAVPPPNPHYDASGSPPHTHAAQLNGGRVATLTAAVPAVFWVTPEFACTGDPGVGNISAPASCDDGLAFTYTIVVAETAERLRVDWDQPFRQDDVELTVVAPSGETESQVSHNTYSEGVVSEAPEVGQWTITVTPMRTDGTRIRMRAALVDDAPRRDGPLLPNLRVTPPFEFGFVAPTNPLNPVFLAGDDQNPPLTVAGETLTSCAADEVIEAADPTRQDEPTVLTRCLRFSSGPANVGEGHSDLRFPIVDRLLADQDRIEEMTQIIHHADGSTSERPAGTYEYHVTHGHYHYLDILFYEAYQVVDQATGTLAPVGVGRKSGFCPADQGYGEWTAFNQGPGGVVGELQGDDNCFATSGNGAMGLSAGWGDFYRWQRAGQYVDFSGVGDGHYVIRATVDVLDNVLESDDTDNASYAYLCIEGDDITVLERGYGTDPWDPARVIATDNRAATTCTTAPAGQPVVETVSPDAAVAAPPAETAAPTTGHSLPSTGGGGAAALGLFAAAAIFWMTVGSRRQAG